MKIIIKGKPTKEFLERAADRAAEIFINHVPTIEELQRNRERHERIVAMVDAAGIVGKEERQAMYDQIVDREEDDWFMKQAIEGYWAGDRVVCDLGSLKDCGYDRERIKKLFCEE